MSHKYDVYYQELLDVHAPIILCVLSSLSILGSCLILGTYVIYKDIRSPSRHIIVCISLADLVASIANLFADYFVNPKQVKSFFENCTLQSFVGTTAITCSFMWTMMLAIFLFISIDREKPAFAISLIHPWFHLICWLFPLAVNVVALVLGKLGNNKETATAGWCWIRIETGSAWKDFVLWMILDGKGLEILTYLVIVVLYTKLKFHLKAKISKFERRESLGTGNFSSFNLPAAKQVDRKLILLPVLYILLRIWGTIRFFLFIEQNGESVGTFSKVLLIMQLFGDNLVGTANCILFCFLTPKVRNHLRDSFQRHILQCRKCYRTEEVQLDLSSDEEDA